MSKIFFLLLVFLLSGCSSFESKRTRTPASSEYVLTQYGKHYSVTSDADFYAGGSSEVHMDDEKVQLIIKERLEDHLKLVSSKCKNKARDITEMSVEHDSPSHNDLAVRFKVSVYCLEN